MRLHRLFALIALAAVLAGCAPRPLWGPTPTVALPDVVQTLRALPPTATPFQPLLPTPEPPVPTVAVPPTATPFVFVGGAGEGPILYESQSGDSLVAIAAHFRVDPAEITSPGAFPSEGLIDPGTLLIIPDRLPETRSPSERILPDSELVYSPTAVDFDIFKYVSDHDGYLNEYREWLGSTAWTSGAESVNRIAVDYSINPRLLLALIQYQSNWVLGQPTNLAETDYPLGHQDYYFRGLFRQLMWTNTMLSQGYYGWRRGTLTDLTFPDGSTLALDPQLNAGSVAVMYFFAQLLDREQWAQAIDPRAGFPAMYTLMFGDAWQRAMPIYPAGIFQPEISLPFVARQTWYFTGGPHGLLTDDGLATALDFAPQSDTPGCFNSDLWVVAAAPGLVVRSAYGTVMLDLDGDGNEHTGWVLHYLHVATNGRARAGTYLEQDDLIGHPSCEGGVATGTHLHFGRKYNGEWVAAGGPLPFTLSGWVAHNGGEPYLGTMTRGDQTVTADRFGSAQTRIQRTDE